MLDVGAITTDLEQVNEGFWVSRTASSVSYPAEGNEACFAIEEGSFWFRHRNAVLTRLVHDYSPDRVLLDIGGGNGCVAQALQSSGIDVVLVEPGAAGAANARSRGVRQVVQATLEDARFESGSIPTAGMFDVLEHLPAADASLRHLHRVLQPDGLLYLTVPAYNGLWSVDDRQAGHITRYTTSTLNALLQESGFDVLFSSYLFSCLTLPIFLFRSLPSRLGLRREVTIQRATREHQSGNGILQRLLQWSLNRELQRIAQRRSVPFGSSCLAVARKRS